MVYSSVRKGFLLYRDWVVHAPLATHATLGTLAALGVIFHVIPALCPFEPRRPRGEMQAVPCGARSSGLHLPALGSALSRSIIPGSVFRLKSK